MVGTGSREEAVHFNPLLFHRGIDRYPYANYRAAKKKYTRSQVREKCVSRPRRKQLHYPAHIEKLADGFNNHYQSGTVEYTAFTYMQLFKGSSIDICLSVCIILPRSVDKTASREDCVRRLDGKQIIIGMKLKILPLLGLPS